MTEREGKAAELRRLRRAVIAETTPARSTLLGEPVTFAPTSDSPP